MAKTIGGREQSVCGCIMEKSCHDAGFLFIILNYQCELIIKLIERMFYAPMGRFQFELFIFITYFPTVVPFNVLFSVENVALTTEGLQERKYNIEWDNGGKIGNKNK